MISLFPNSRRLAVPAHPRFAGGADQKYVESSAKHELSQEAAHVLPSLATIGLAGIVGLVGAFMGYRINICKQVMKDLPNNGMALVPKETFVQGVWAKTGILGGLIALPLSIVNMTGISVLEKNIVRRITQNAEENLNRIRDLGQRITQNTNRVTQVKNKNWAEMNLDRRSIEINALTDRINENSASWISRIWR